MKKFLLLCFIIFAQKVSILDTYAFNKFLDDRKIELYFEAIKGGAIYDSNYHNTHLGPKHSLLGYKYKTGQTRVTELNAPDRVMGELNAREAYVKMKTGEYISIAQNRALIVGGIMAVTTIGLAFLNHYFSLDSINKTMKTVLISVIGGILTIVLPMTTYFAIKRSYEEDGIRGDRILAMNKCYVHAGYIYDEPSS